MNQSSGGFTKPQLQLANGTAQSEAAIDQILPSLQISELFTSDFNRSWKVNSFELGDLLYKDNTPSADRDSATRKHSDCYLVCQGRVRLLCWDAQRERSAVVLEEGAIFGVDDQFCETALPYQAIAASAGQVAVMPATTLRLWLDRLPQLREMLQQQTTQRQKLIFFKTYFRLGETAPLTSQQIQQISPYLEEICVPAGTVLAQTNDCDPGCFWLRQGELTSSTQQTPTIGAAWKSSDLAIVDWIAQTDLVLYKLPEACWQTVKAIVPVLSPYLIESSPEGSSSQAESRFNLSPNLKRLRSRSSQSRNAAANFEQPQSDQIDSSRSIRKNIVNFPQPTTRKRRRWHHPFIQQQSASDCGVTCLAMIGQYWGQRFSINMLRELAKVGRSGTSLKNLAVAAESLGFQARPVRASLTRLVDQKSPWIAHWEGDHYVVIYRVKGDRVLVADPARGKRTLTHQEFLNHWTGYALLLDPTAQLKSAKTPERNLSRFWEIFWSYRSVLWQIILLSLLVQLFGLITPLFTQIILDRVVTEKSLPTLNVFAAGLFLFGVWRVGLVAVRQYLLDYFSNRIDLTLVSGFVSHALTLPLKFFESRQVGDILTRVQENSKIQEFLMRQAISTWLDASMAIVYIGLMFYYNWQLSLLVLALIPPIVILAVGATPFLRQISREVFNETAEQNSLLVEMMSGVATVKSVAAEREVRWRWEERLIGMLNAHFKGQKLANGLQVASALFNSIGSTALLWYGATLVIQDQLTIGQFVAFNMLIGNVISPVLSLVELWDEFQEVLISVERLNDVFMAEPEETPGQPMLVLPPVRGDLRLENVTFRYEQAEEQNTLQNVSVEIEGGQTIAIVGRSGSGKTTLVKLLQGLYHPTNGRIYVDGHDIRHVSPQSLRSQMGVVPQECFLFSGTILENIQLYRPEFSLDQVIEVAKLAEAHAFIQELPLGYHTKVGERGANLSGGQRQRIAIARALLGNPAILLLDEATSSLDTESERRFQQNLARIGRGRTILIIAHRLSTVKNADRILVLDRGILIEQGTHEQLIAHQGLYSHLAQQQLDL